GPRAIFRPAPRSRSSARKRSDSPALPAIPACRRSRCRPDWLPVARWVFPSLAGPRPTRHCLTYPSILSRFLGPRYVSYLSRGREMLEKPSFPYGVGFRSLTEETPEPVSLKVDGALPPWLEG